ncbi:porin family protein [Bacteroidales bacterium OttesenSCG-928-L03]|nr:porin family protein [Bacteroidales bacterium OttesenSCG-928-L03]
MNKDLFDDVIKDKLEDLRLPADDFSWNEIESKLKARQKVIRLRRMSVMAAAACIAVLIMIIPFYQNINKNSLDYETTILSQNEQGLTEDVSEKTDDVLSLPAGDETQLVAVVEKEKPSRRRSDPGSGHPVTNVEEPSTPQQEELTIPTEELQPSSPQKSQEDWEELLLATLRPKETNFAVKRKKTTHIGLSVSAGNNHMAMNSNPVLASDNYNSLRASGEKLSPSAPKEYQEQILSYEDFQDISYSPPLSFGLSVRKELNPRLAIETGINYTYLASHFKNENPKREADLYLHYLGVPINLVAKLYSNPNWNVYLSAGAMVEKGIYSDYTQREYGNSGSVLKTPSSEKSIDGVQLSAHLAPGVEYKLNKSYSIYLEPQVGYFFDNDQPVSVRTKQPLNVGLTAGLRFSL